jgi:hypothetical protein
MKRVLMIAVALVVAACAFGQVVVYENAAELEWNDTNVLLPDDSVTYDIYFYDVSNPPADAQDTAQLQYAGSVTDVTTYTIVFPERQEWVVGVRSTVTDGGGTPGTPSAIAWSNVLGDVDIATMGGPFTYVPLIQGQALTPDNLRDARY